MAQELRIGLSYVRDEGPLLVLTFLAFITTFLGASLLTLLPIFAQTVFHKGVGEYSELMAFSGAGAVCGALVVAWLGRFRRMGTTALVVQVVFGLLIIGFAVSRIELLSEAMLFAGGAAMMIVFSSTNSLVQLVVPNEMRGRVMSIYMLAFRGGMTLGALAAGTIAALSSAPFVVALSGSLLVLVAVAVLFSSQQLRDL